MDRQLQLTFTGERRKGRVLVHVCGAPVWLTGNQFQLLMILALARGSDKWNGFVSQSEWAIAYPVAIYRLRRVLDAAVGCGIGDALIETGAGSEYRLCPDIALGVEATFGPVPGLLTLAEAVELRRHCREITP